MSTTEEPVPNKKPSFWARHKRAIIISSVVGAVALGVVVWVVVKKVMARKAYGAIKIENLCEQFQSQLNESRGILDDIKSKHHHHM